MKPRSTWHPPAVDAKGKPLPPAQQPLVFTRADPAALARFDPSTKQCSMNCGPHRDDPRSRVERMFLCPECWPTKG